MNNFHYGERFKKRETYILKTCIYIKRKSLGNFSVPRFGEISKPAHKQRFGFRDSSFFLILCYTMTFKK